MSKAADWLRGALALAVCSAAGVAHAQSNVSLYGQVDAWVGAAKAPGGERAWTQGGGGMSTSYWGMKGSEDLGDGLKAIFTLEDFFLPQSGRYGRFTGDSFFSRNAYVGLQSNSLGTVTMGRLTTSYFVSTILFNPFVDSYTFSPMVYHTFLGLAGQGIVGDSGWSNTVMYATPDYKGLGASFSYAFGNKAGEMGQNKWSAAAMYFHGPLAATLAYQQVKFDSTPDDQAGITGFRNQQALQAGLTYDFQAVKLYGQYQYIKNTITGGNLTSNGAQLGVSVPLGGGSVMASFAYTKNSGMNDTSRSTWALGYDYHLSKRTDLYVAYLNDKVSGLEAGNTFGMGMRTKF
ncbi:porin [Pandoraea sp. SD6-2]|uniref:porin n=1 Tax=Pandoraea sp. SD6-2 TaxID=1286093 RepID=UPI00032E6A1B|nr:porin [Pandoraea sp. SD6-2]EON13651.1 porin [Pandoraea sp. SD6-2]